MKIYFCAAYTIVLVGTIFCRPAFAYIDPGAGSYILQIAAAALFGVIFSAKIWWGKFKGLWSRSRPEKKESEKEHLPKS